MVNKLIHYQIHTNCFNLPKPYNKYQLNITQLYGSYISIYQLPLLGFIVLLLLTIMLFSLRLSLCLLYMVPTWCEITVPLEIVMPSGCKEHVAWRGQKYLPT
jgi:hypothetical protein